MSAEKSPTDNAIALRPSQSTAANRFPPAPAPTAFGPLRLVHAATPTPEQPPPSTLGGGRHR